MGLRCYLKLCLVVVCVPTQATNDTEAEVHLERPQCFLRRQIESTKFINDSQILFSMRAGGYFLNTLEKSGLMLRTNDRRIQKKECTPNTI